MRERPGGEETAAIGGLSLRESADWPGREQGEGLISQKRPQRLQSGCEAADPAAGPGRARRDGGDGVISTHSDRFH